jgi:hypothetical protein
MESKVKSHISNKTYISNLDTLEEEDKDLKSELYMIPVSGRKIMVAPGKSRMDENGIAFCYVYVIQRDKVISKLGVYEKKSDSMPLIFDISTFPEGSFCLFEEFEKNPSKLIDFQMKEESTVFDFLMTEFPKIEDKKKTLKSAYRITYELYNKDENKEDKKKMKPILAIISAASKEEDPTGSFLNQLKDTVHDTTATDKTVFVYSLIALQPVFNIEFQLNTENEKYQEIKSRWPIQGETRKMRVDVESYEIMEEPVEESVKESVKESVEESVKVSAKEVNLDAVTPAKDSIKEETSEVSAKEINLDAITPSKDSTVKLDDSAPTQEDQMERRLDTLPEMKQEDPFEEMKEDPEEMKQEPDEMEESVKESIKDPVKKSRKSRTPKSDQGEAVEKPKASKKSTKPIVIGDPLGTAINSVKPTIKVPASKKIQMKSTAKS